MPESVWWIAIGVLYLPLIVGCVAWLGSRAVPSAWGLGLGLLVGAAVAGATWAAGSIPLLRQMEIALREMLGDLSFPTVLALAIASAVGEELLFRGVLLPWLGVVPSTLLFGAVHVPHTRALWPWPIFALAMGGLFAWLTVWTGDPGAAIGGHFAVNLLNLNRLAGAQG